MSNDLVWSIKYFSIKRLHTIYKYIIRNFLKLWDNTGAYLPWVIHFHFIFSAQDEDLEVNNTLNNTL